MTVGRAIVMGLLGLLLYFEHLICIFLFLATIGILATVFTALAAWRKHQRGELNFAQLWPGIRSRALIAFAALTPAILLAAWFQHRRYIGTPSGMKFALRNAQYWKDLLGLNILISYRPALAMPFARATAAVILL